MFRLKKNPPILVLLVLVMVFLNISYACGLDLNTLKGCGYNSDCVLQLLIKESTIKNHNVILARYLSLVKEDQKLKASCHTVTHKYGEWVFSKYGSRAFDPSSTECLSGYTHGFVVGMSKKYHDKPNMFINEAIILCKKIEDSVKRSLCMHGIGHGATYISDSLAKANSLCLQIDKSKYQSECVNGASMEWGNSKIGKDNISYNRLVHLCDNLKNMGKLRKDCLSQILQIQSNSPVDLQKFKIFCNTQEKDVTAGCYEALGYMIANQNFDKLLENPKVVLGLINVYCGTTKEQWCMNSIINRSISLTMNKNMGNNLCRDIKISLRRKCQEAVDNANKNIEN